LKVSSHVGRRSDGGHSDHSPELETTVHGHRKKNECVLSSFLSFYYLD
jgi:hypothetical protein